MIETYSAVMINKPLEEVFAYATNLNNAVAFVPNLIEVSNLEPARVGVGQKFNWQLNMSGTDSRGEGEVVEFVPNQRIKLAINGDAHGTWDVIFGEENGLTNVKAQIDYEVSENVMAKIAKTVVMDKLGKKYNQMLLENLKILLED